MRRSPLSAVVLAVLMLSGETARTARAGGFADAFKMVGQLLKSGDLAGDALDRFAADPQSGGDRPAFPAAPGLGSVDLEGILQKSGLDAQSLGVKLEQLSGALGGGSGGGGPPSLPVSLPFSLPGLPGGGATTATCPAGQPCSRAAETPSSGPKTIANPYVTPGKSAGKLPQIILGPQR